MNRELLCATLADCLAHPRTADLAAVLQSVHPSDLAGAMHTASDGQVMQLLAEMNAQERADIFVYFSPERQTSLLALLPRHMAVALVEGMAADERADLYHQLDESQRERLLLALNREERDDILRLAAYAEGSTGSATTSDFVALRPDMRVDEALRQVRATAADRETIYIVYVLDKEGRLCGTLSLRELLLADDARRIGDIMRRQPVWVRAESPRAEAAELIRRYDLLALPVVNGEERMIGIITVDDAMDIEKETDAAQLARFGGTAAGGETDLDILATPLPQMFRVRVFWLILLTLFGVATSAFVAAQEAMLSQVIVLAAFIAPIVDMGGNTGSQSASLVIRGMALGDIGLCWRDVLRVVRRELPVAAGLGLVVALLEGIMAFFAKGIGGDVLLVVGLSMLICTALGGVVGALLPFLARRLGTDPATLSSPLITSVMDLAGVFVYFSLAYVFLGNLLGQASH